MSYNNMLDEKIKTAVERYQCVGCVNGSDTECYEKGNSEACEKHVAGTMITGIGTIFLGMPKGFDRLGYYERTKISIFRGLEDGWGYDHFNVPVWKHKDKHGNVITRGLSPRINLAWIHVFLTDCLARIDCLEITEKELEEMD